MQDLPSTFSPHFHKRSSMRNSNSSLVQTSCEYRASRTCKSDPLAMSNDEKFSWSHEATCDLIQLYKKHPALYATMNNDYKNKDKRLKALKTIRAELAKRGKRPTIDDIKRKIHGLRTQYAHQLSKMKKSDGEDVRPTLWCYNQLDFLRSSYDGQTSQDETINESKDLGEFTVFEQQDNDDSQEVASFYDDSLVKQEATPTNSIPETPVFASASDIGGKTVKTGDDLSLFGKLVELELRKITKGQSLRKAKKEIISVLMDAQDACDD